MKRFGEISAAVFGWFTFVVALLGFVLGMLCAIVSRLIVRRIARAVR